MTADSSSNAYENDILGNRTRKNRTSQTGGVKYEWDELNRMTKTMNTSTGARYVYRADGMRTQKVEGFNLSWAWTDRLHTSGYYDVVTATNLPTTRYFYDGQMAMEDDYTHHVGSADQVDVTRYGLGARGIDRIEKTSDAYGSPSTTVSYPIYDGHGNMVRTLSKSGSGYSVTAERIFGAWGEVRNSSGPSDSKGKYCANLGHVQDDESGLIYMRARYYEPSSGRFVSEDPARKEINWFCYSNNDPVNESDFNGKETMSQAFAIALIAALVSTITAWLSEASMNGKTEGFGTPAVIVAAITSVVTGLAEAFFADGKKLGPKAFTQKISQNIWKGIFTGAGIGVAVAMYYGARAGQVYAELIYIDNWEAF